MLAPWDLAELREGGLRVIVSLSEEVDPDEIIGAGLRLYRFVLPPLLILAGEQRRGFLEAVEAALPIIQGEIAADRPVLVHCHEGKDRTGLLLACYLMRYQALSADEAIDRVRAARPGAMSALGYEEAVREFGRRQKTRRPRSRGS
jgi:protein-tyrosine phosphatase